MSGSGRLTKLAKPAFTWVNARTLVLNVSTGALVRVISARAYRFASPIAIEVAAPHLYVTKDGAGADGGWVTALTGRGHGRVRARRVRGRHTRLLAHGVPGSTRRAHGSAGPSTPLFGEGSTPVGRASPAGGR
jgi:hypothetical protein